MSLVTKKLIWLAAAAALLMSTGANAQTEPLSKDEQNCMNEVNKRFSLVAKTKHKEIEKCIKDFSKGKLAEDFEADECRDEDPKGKIAKQEASLSSGYGKKCVDKGVDGSVADAFGVPDIEPRAKAEGVDKEKRLLNAILGLALDAAVVVPDPEGDMLKEEKAASGCQLGLMKELYKCQDTKLKEFLSCKKNGLKNEEDPILNAGDLGTACLEGGIPDPKGKIAKACVEKVNGTAGKKCAEKGVMLADVFGESDCAKAPPGGPDPTEVEIRVCLETAVECDLCNSINFIDGTSVDCDLFDNDAADLSCGACRNAYDQKLFPLLDIEEPPVAVCVALCAGDEACMADCFVDGCVADCQGDTVCEANCQGISFQDPNCAPCIAFTFDCTVASGCLPACSLDPLSPACTTCLADNGCFECL